LFSTQNAAKCITLKWWKALFTWLVPQCPVAAHSSQFGCQLHRLHNHQLCRVLQLYTATVKDNQLTAILMTNCCPMHTMIHLQWDIKHRVSIITSARWLHHYYAHQHSFEISSSSCIYTIQYTVNIAAFCKSVTISEVTTDPWWHRNVHIVIITIIKKTVKNTWYVITLHTSITISTLSRHVLLFQFFCEKKLFFKFKIDEHWSHTFCRSWEIMCRKKCIINHPPN